MSSKPFLTVAAWAAGTVSLAAFAAAWVLAARNGDLFDISAEFGPDRFMIAYAVAGTLLASRRRANPVGWFLLGIGLVTALRGLAGAFLVITWLAPVPVKLGDGLPDLPNPTGLRHLSPRLYGPFGDSTWILGFVLLLLAVASVVLRYRRSAAEERLQLKWFAYAAAVSLGLIFALLPVAPMGQAGQVTYDLAIVAGIGLALPVAIGVAVLKYRLYAIDRIISRTVSYVLVTGLVVGVYLGCIALLSQVRPVRGSVGIAASVLVAAALFNPLRRRVQAAVDRRFDRAGYDAERVVTGFSERLREQVNLDVLGADLIGVVQHVLAPEHVSLWLRDQPEGEERTGAGR
jgi:hypothetical protein